MWPMFFSGGTEENRENSVRRVCPSQDSFQGPLNRSEKQYSLSHLVPFFSWVFW
jgi:hypothetical protein